MVWTQSSPWQIQFESNPIISYPQRQTLSVKGSGCKLYRYQLPHLYILVRDTTTVIQHVLSLRPTLGLSSDHLSWGPGGLERWFHVGSTWHAQAVMCFRLCLCSSQRGGSQNVVFFLASKETETYRIFVLLEHNPKIFLLEKKSNVLENKLTTDPNFDYGGRQRSWVGDFIHLTFGCPEMLNTTDFLGLFFHAFVTTGDGHRCRSILNDNFQLPRNFPQRKMWKSTWNWFFKLL